MSLNIGDNMIDDNIEFRNEEFDQVLSAINSSYVDLGSITFCIGSYLDADKLEIRRLEISKKLAEELIIMLKNYLNELNNKIDRILLYDAGYTPDIGELEYLTLPDEFISNIINNLPNTFNMAPFNINDKNFIENSKFYLIIFKSNKLGLEPIYFFYTRKKMKSLSKDTRLVFHLFGDIFDSLNDTIFLLDKNIDCLYYKNKIYIINKNNFHDIFNYYSGLRELAKNILFEIRNKIPISNFDDFEHACLSNKNMISILINIDKRGYLKDLYLEKLLKIITNNNLDIKIDYSGGIPNLIYEKNNKFAILRLLNDDYLKSIMTDMNYEVNSKRNL